MTGRPPLRPTAEQRRQVSIWRAGGMSEPDIAAVLKISRTTLRKAYKVELAQGSAEKRADMLTKLFKTGMAGNVAAQKEFLRRADLARAEEEFLGRRDAAKAEDRPAPAPKGPLGKKQQAAIDAETAAIGTDWGDDLDPAIVN